ncbi:phospholipase A2 inhibitor and Ly6/PLAUR domain-containing protein-like [Hyperolius riggenbachi]|uniref:phospholipase A2 inhibitor and Ly6/PLAUR domain-containing protein-like n=1 Tax=Hyperolius riggenbachi TaxID=752182 RepID=UPI0035A2FB5C
MGSAIRVPAESRTKNGVFCPACYSEKGDCEAQNSMACTGEEKYCLKYQKMVMMGLQTSVSSGCASENVCKENRTLSFLTPPRLPETSECFKVSSNTDLKPGHFIWCHICHSHNFVNCMDKSFLCSPSEDVCLYENTRSTYDGRDEFEITNRCGKSSECSRTGTIRSSTKVIVINTTCCDRNECQPPFPALPTISDKDNGLTCPACFVPNSDRCLGRKNVKCTGEEKRCIHYMRTEKQEISTVTESLYGCTTDTICEAGSSLTLPKGHYHKSVKTDIACNRAATLRSLAHVFFTFSIVLKANL